VSSGEEILDGCSGFSNSSQCKQLFASLVKDLTVGSDEYWSFEGMQWYSISEKYLIKDFF
jgi:hypothetical protein